MHKPTRRPAEEALMSIAAHDDAFDDPYALPPPIAVSPGTGLAALKPPEPALLGPIAPGSIALIRGPRGAGKSWLALAIAHCDRQRR
jgi:hypothetical protein